MFLKVCGNFCSYGQARIYTRARARIYTRARAQGGKFSGAAY